LAELRRLGLADYEPIWQDMQAFSAQRTPETRDELWLTEHPPVYTLGLNRKDVRLPWRDDIPLVLTDRGGKITYHGPGQIVLYLLLDLKRRGMTVRQLVDRMEGAIIALLQEYGISAEGRPEAPGVYVNGAKIASLGLRLKNGCCYHGLSLNVDMDLSPFQAIDPCGYRGLQVTQTRDLGIGDDMHALSDKLLALLQAQLS
jgi:lipoyl(octanoyl) transferase